jgi:hypothetical protein
MVREDYEYVNKASTICLTTTSLGQAFLDTFASAELEATGVNPLVDLLLLVDQEYVEVEGGLDTWLPSVNKAEQEYGSKPVVTRKTLVEALDKGYLGIHKVIWD